MPPSKRSPSIYSVSDLDTPSDYAPSPEAKPSPAKGKHKTAGQAKRKFAAGDSKKDDSIVDIEDISIHVDRKHGQDYHDVENVVSGQRNLLAWFEKVREKRGMPWRKKYDPTLNMEEKGQRAYEVSYLEVMLQQTQVATVIAYWQKWIAKWPTIADLAKADVEEVNAAWRGLGYYRRARSLLEGAKTVMSNSKYHGRLPSDPVVLEKEITGVGRYTAGAICSMAYGIKTPIVDGNIHRLLTRLLALYAPQTAPLTIKFLWAAAQKLVEQLPEKDTYKGITGDWNQALMELGSQVCKPVSAECGTCPLQKACKAYSELSEAPTKIVSTETKCQLCAPIPREPNQDRIPSVTVFPMKKEKKLSRIEEESVCVIEWQGLEQERRWLFTKRPEKGLLAGLYEPPTIPVASGSTFSEKLSASIEVIGDCIFLSRDDIEIIKASSRRVRSISHIFSHINMTYHIFHIIVNTPTYSPFSIKDNAPRPIAWLNAEEVEGANVGTGVKKVWAEIYGSWGSFEVSLTGSAPRKKRKTCSQVTKKVTNGAAEGKVVKKILMPVMPVRKRVEDEAK
ncbi:A/G-specific adenine glycosylase [Cryptococcus depauperatus CBS 7841]|uniref:Adenine DNA glycosylase n=1 Tax=Cryptococcus depauperatus CBS 7841 TaxID=1295531 RepID=A0A1E3I469_9TREE|nr:A/G-specific adenine glycosylase [Cryptococcus depauperatus CBS 7841]